MTSHQTVALARGRHSDPSKGACVMELASMLADEPFSDHPRAVCPVIGRYLRTLNDGLDDERRQRLYAVAAAVVGTAGRRRDRARRRAMCRDRLVALRGPSSRAERWFASLLYDEVAEACAAAFLDSERHEDAVSFAIELAGGEPVEAASPARRTRVSTRARG